LITISLNHIETLAAAIHLSIKPLHTWRPEFAALWQIPQKSANRRSKLRLVFSQTIATLQSRLPVKEASFEKEQNQVDTSRSDCIRFGIFRR
jgi:hypothetical protein